MKQTRDLMGMHITVEVVDKNIREQDIDKVYDYLEEVDKRFSTYKNNSEISYINTGKIAKKDYSPQMQEIFDLAEKTKRQTDGYFDIFYKGRYDPSGVVKGWAIYNAAKILQQMEYENYYVDAGGDIQVSGKNEEGKNWRVGIKNPFNQREIVKVVEIDNQGVATSGTYIRGDHIYNPKEKSDTVKDVVSLTVIGPDILEADRFATAAFAMGREGISFIEKLPGFEGYMITMDKQATFTSGFDKYVADRN